jgi:hypothetical protein
MKVKIIKARKPSYWYAKKIGKVFFVHEYDRTDYLATTGERAGIGCIKKKDCIVIKQ